jgi:multidrug efflux pump subunit AcrA (membrane-fusion protein)
MSKKMKIGIALVVLVIAAVVITTVVKKRSQEGIEVTVAKVGREDLTSRVSANGNIEAKRKVDLSANIMGQITNLAVREGDVVKKGDFLLQIDRTQHAASAASASASLQSLFSDREAARASAKEAALAYSRAQKSYSDKLIPLSDLERAKAQLDSTHANVNALEGRIASARAGDVGAR